MRTRTVQRESQSMEVALRDAKVTGLLVVTECNCSVLRYFPPTLKDPVKNVKIINDVQLNFLRARDRMNGTSVNCSLSAHFFIHNMLNSCNV
jgi:hypothetical protein